MPEKIVHLDRTIIRRPDVVFLVSVLIGLAAGSFGYIEFGLPGVVAFSLLGFFVALPTLIYLFGFQIDRVIRFSKQNMEVWSGTKLLFESPWDSICGVHRVGRSGFEIESDSGKVTIWLPAGVIEAKEYGAFLKQILLAMSGEDLEQSLAHYPAPTVLEPGVTYEYFGDGLLKRTRSQYLFVILFACAAILIGLLKRDYCGPVGPVLFVIFSISRIQMLAEEIRRVKGTSISVQEGHLLVCRGGKTDKFVNRVWDRSLKPEAKSSPFSQCEIFGDSTNNVRVDRRFLKKQTQTMNLGSSSVVLISES